MKKIFMFLAAAVMTLPAMADEGMWLLPYLQKMNIGDMKARGCKLSAEDIYSVNGSSLKDAIVVFGGGCTGEIVSPEGLLFTNHHCGYGAIQQLSSVEHDYLQNGFWAMSQAEELPVEGLEVRFVRKFIDVTPEIVGNIPSIAGQEEYRRIVAENRKALRARLEEENPGMEIVIRSFFGGNQFFAMIMECYTDVRLVGTPPSSIGKYGGDTDNWMWPRHTGDFSIFRVYAGADNRPADYSPENRPYRAETYLKISTKGYKEGDFAMIMGFPGSTDRYMTSWEIDRMLTQENPNLIHIRGERQAILWDAMMSDPAVRIQYASKYAGSSNYWKNSIGKSRGVEKLNVKARKEAQEAAFQKWAVENTLPEEGYVDALDKIRTATVESAEDANNMEICYEAFLGTVELLDPARYVSAGNPKDKLLPWAEDFYKDYNAALDRKVAKRMLEIAREKMTERPSFYTQIESDFGGDIAAFVDHLYDNSALTSLEGFMGLFDAEGACDTTKVMADPAVSVVKSVLALRDELRERVRPYNSMLSEGHRKYIAGLMLQHPDKAWSSDANFTLRLTYGRVLPYTPADGVRYSYYTTLKGVMEKEDPENPAEFTVPARLKELYEAGDYGPYADKDGTLHTCFLADCDITGGNSGSPVLNARGELVGLAFDGNWEAMSGDIAFEPELQRTIVVDVRYLLFIVDKFAGASWLLDELSM